MRDTFIVGPLPLLEGFSLGPARYLHDLANALRDRGHRVLVVCQRDAWRDTSARYEQINLWNAGSAATFPAIYWCLLKKRAAAVNMHHEVHMYGEKLAEVAFVMFLALCRLSGMRVVTTLYYAKSARELRDLSAAGIISRKEYAPVLFLAYRFFLVCVAFFSNRVMVAEPGDVDAFPAWSKSRVRVVPLLSIRAPVSSSDTERTRRTYYLPENYALFFGNVNKYKGLENFIEAARTLSDRIAFVATGGRNVASAIDAPPEYLDYYRQLHDAAIRAGILWLGYVPERDIDSILKACTVLVLPYIVRMGASGPLATATSLGVPVLLSRAMDVPEYSTVALEPSAAGVIAAVERFLDDPSYAAAVARAGRRLIESRSAASIVERYVDALCSD